MKEIVRKQITPVILFRFQNENRDASVNKCKIMRRIQVIAVLFFRLDGNKFASKRDAYEKSIVSTLLFVR